MRELKKIYNKISKQTQNRLQEIFNSIDFDYKGLYEIVNNKTKKRVNTYIEEWKDKGLLKGYFGMLANNIYKKTRVKNSEILELLIYSAYIEEQNKLDEIELSAFKDVSNYYYKEGQEEVNKASKKRKEVSVIPDAIFLALLNMPNAKGYIWKDYIETITKYNADQIYRQCTIDIQQQKQLEITNGIYQNLIKRQQNTRLNINNDKISGNIDLTLIGINNKAKAEGMYSFDDKAKCKFISVEDEATTKMCHSLNGQEFHIHDWNEFKRYSKSNGCIKKYRCYGLVAGLNLPPINDGFHWCRSYLIYLPSTKQENDVSFDEKDNLIINGIKILSNNELNKINRIALLENLNRMEKTFKDFPILKNRNIKYEVIKIKDNSAMAVRPINKKCYVLEINQNVFNSKIKEFYNLGTKKHDNPKGTTYKDIAIHETGHMVSFEIIKKVNNNSLKAMKFDYDNNITTNNIVEKAFNNLNIYDNIKKEKLIRNISNYAMQDSQETIGEAFADYYRNKEKSNILSKEIVKVMKGMI